MHALLDLHGNISTFFYIFDGKLLDVNILNLLPSEAGAFYIMDRSYLNFERLYRMNLCGFFFVFKAKMNTKLLKLKSNPVDRSIDLVCDQVAKTNGINSKERYQEKLRRTEFSEPETGKTLVFLQIILRCHPKQLRLYANRVEKLNYFFMDQETPRIKFFSKCSKGPNLDFCVG